MKLRSMVCSPKFLAVFPLILALLLGVACGGDAATPPPAATAAPTSTPQPTPTPQPTLDFAALAQQFGSQVQRDIASQIAGIEFPEGLTAEDVQAIVAAAISNIPEGLTPEDVQAIVTQAISEIPEGLTAAQMEAAIKNAVDAGVQRAVSEAVAQIPPHGHSSAYRTGRRYDSRGDPAGGCHRDGCGVQRSDHIKLSKLTPGRSHV